jgi:Tachylectin
MTASLFTTTPTPPTFLKVEPGQEGRFSFTVTSLSAPDKVHELILQALLIGSDGTGKEVDWLVAGPSRILSMSGGKTETVVITARPTTTSPRGESSIKLAVADKAQPNDAYVYSPSVACEVSSPPVVTTSPKKRLLEWLIPAIVGGLVIIGGGVAVWMVIKEPGTLALGAPCGNATAKACGEGLLCAPGAQRCLLVGGARCEPTQADRCASGECDSGKVCAAPLGFACDPGDAALVPCPRLDVCDPITNTCMRKAGAPCESGSQCITADCSIDKRNNAKVCTALLGAIARNEPCGNDPARTCDNGLLCASSVAGAQRCLLAAGGPCARDDLCASGECESRNGVCTTALGLVCDPGNPDLAPCPRNSPCDSNRKKCLVKEGKFGCETDAHCVTNKCNTDKRCAVAPSGGVIYGLLPDTQTGHTDLLWYGHTGRDSASPNSWAIPAQPKKLIGSGAVIGSGWDLKQVFSGCDGLIYGVPTTGELWLYRHDGRGDGSWKWAYDGQRKVVAQEGWSNYEYVFSGGRGVIYAVTEDHDLLWFRHDGQRDANDRWTAPDGKKVATGWNFTRMFSGSDGVIYTITANGDLLWNRHLGRGDGSARWAEPVGRKIGAGWHLEHLHPFAGGEGLIYAVRSNGDLRLYRHQGHDDGTDRWKTRDGEVAGVGWKVFTDIFSGECLGL